MYHGSAILSMNLSTFKFRLSPMFPSKTFYSFMFYT